MVRSNNPRIDNGSEDQSVMKTEEGKFVTVRKSEGKLRLCAVEGQNEEKEVPLVHIKKRENDSNQMALCFKHEGDYYFPKVLVGGKLLVDKADDNISDSHWFRKNDLGAGDHYCLESVFLPNSYLKVDGNSRQHEFLLSTEMWSMVTDEKVSSTTPHSASSALH